MSTQVVTASYTAYVKDFLDQQARGDLQGDIFGVIMPADYKTWASWMAYDWWIV